MSYKTELSFFTVRKTTLNFNHPWVFGSTVPCPDCSSLSAKETIYSRIKRQLKSHLKKWEQVFVLIFQSVPLLY